MKVDRTFVERLGGADDSTPMVKTIVEMSHAMGLRVVAEGVSDKRLLDLVVAVGCEAAQGFYWSRPLNTDDFADWWREAMSRHRAVRLVPARARLGGGTINPLRRAAGS